MDIESERSRIDATAIALVVILIGALMLVPGRQWSWLALGVGVILLWTDLFRCFRKMKLRPLALLAGVVALLTGVAGLVWPSLPLLGVFVILAGICVLFVAIVRPWKLVSLCCR